MHLKQREAAAHLEVPRPVASAIKAMKAGTATAEQQQLTFKFWVEDLCGLHSQAFALPEDSEWFNGRRWPGLVVWNVAHAPMSDPDPLPEPPARTATEKQRRRATKIPKQTKG